MEHPPAGAEEPKRPSPCVVDLATAAGEPVLIARPLGRGRARSLALVVPGIGESMEDEMLPWTVDLARRGAVGAALVGRMPVEALNTPDLAGALERSVKELVGRVAAVLPDLQARFGVTGRKSGLIGVSAGGWASLRAMEAGAAASAWVAEAVAAVACGPGWDRIPPGTAGELRALGARVPDGCEGLRVEAPACPLVHPGDLVERARRLAGGGRAVMLAVGGRDPLIDLEQVRAFFGALQGQAPEGHGERVQLLVYPGLGHRVSRGMRRRVVSWVTWMLAAGGSGR